MSEMGNKQAINLLTHIGNQLGRICEPADEEVYITALSKAIDALKKDIVDSPLYTMDYIKMSDIHEAMGLNDNDFIGLDDVDFFIYFRCDDNKVAEIQSEIDSPYGSPYLECWKNELKLVKVLREYGVEEGIWVKMDY